MSIMMQCRTAIQRLVFGNTLIPQAFTIGLVDPQTEITVWLHGMGKPIDVTNRHSMACADPFAVCVAFDEDKTPTTAQLERLSLKFCERDGRMRMLGQIDLEGKSAVVTPAAGSHLVLFRAKHSANYCLPKIRIWAHYLLHRYSLWKKFDSEGKKMSFLERRAVMVMFIRPHPVVLVSLENEFGGNIFPMNIMGNLDNGYFAFALKNSRLAARLVERSKRVALSDVPVAQTPLAYRLGVNHGKASADWDQLPFTTRLSDKFALRVPGFAQRVREVEIQSAQYLGSHTFFVARIVNEQKSLATAGLCIIHGFYQAWRLRDYPAELRNSLTDDLFNKRGTPHSSLPL
jgi:flavin reductase (DIM6/NTAB) family NADH-FMN oxidoreductase RutF